MATTVPNTLGMNAQATTWIGELLFHLTPINEAVVVCQSDVHDGARQYLLADLGAALACQSSCQRKHQVFSRKRGMQDGAMMGFLREEWDARWRKMGFS